MFHLTSFIQQVTPGAKTSIVGFTNILMKKSKEKNRTPYVIYVIVEFLSLYEKQIFMNYKLLKLSYIKGKHFRNLKKIYSTYLSLVQTFDSVFSLIHAYVVITCLNKLWHVLRYACVNACLSQPSLTNCTFSDIWKILFCTIS